MDTIRFILLFIGLGLISCNPGGEINSGEKSGKFSGIIKHGNFSDKILLEIEKDSTNFSVLFTSLAQNANRIPFQDIEITGDSINFKLQSDFYTYSFRNKWIENYNKLQGSLTVDTVTVPYILEKEQAGNVENHESEDVSFESSGLKISGTIWYPKNAGKKAIVILTSSGNADRSASRAEAILFAEMGFTVFHYDKRGTGSSGGNWQTASIHELVEDDINAINYFSEKTGITLEEMGIKGSSQGATKIPYILSQLDDLKYGIVVSCPGVSLLESDLNYWKNRNTEVLGNDLEDAAQLQRRVFEFIAGTLTKKALEEAVNRAKSKPWFEHIWIPNLDEVQTDTKLTYNPIPYFETSKQPVLIMQGKKDEIIPLNSYQLISGALKKSGNDNFRTVLLDGASHSMYDVGQSDFPYWSKLHPDYLTTIEDWIDTVYNKKY